MLLQPAEPMVLWSAGDLFSVRKLSDLEADGNKAMISNTL